MSAYVMPTPKPSFSDATGLPLNGGKLYTYASGTTTPKATYTNAAGTVNQANPIILNARGEPANAIYWDGSYYIELRDALGNLIYSVDNFNTAFSGVSQLPTGIQLVTSPPAGDNSTKVATTEWVDAGFVQMGTGIGQNGNTVKIGNSPEGRVRITVDTTDLGPIAMAEIDNRFQALQSFFAGINSIEFLTISSTAGNALLQLQTSAGVRSLVQAGSSWQFLSNTNATIAQLDNSGNMTALTFTPTSDKTKKKDWTLATDAQLDAFFDLVDVGTFTWVDSGVKSLGAPAQDIEAIFPEAVYTDEKGNKFLNYDGLNCVILHGIGRRMKGKW